MIKIKFNSPQEMILWLMNNEGQLIADNYGREWKYKEYTFYFKDLGDAFKEGVRCLHLFGTDLYHTI